MNTILIDFLNHIFGKIQEILPVQVNFQNSADLPPGPVTLESKNFHIFDFQENEVFYMGEFETFSESRKCIHTFMQSGEDVYFAHHSKFEDFVNDKYKNGQTFILLSCPEGKTISDKIESV